MYPENLQDVQWKFLKDAETFGSCPAQELLFKDGFQFVENRLRQVLVLLAGQESSHGSLNRDRLLLRFGDFRVRGRPRLYLGT